MGRFVVFLVAFSRARVFELECVLMWVGFGVAYYNAGSAAIVLVLIALMVGGFVWWRSRRGGIRGLPLSTAEVGNEEETIPLTLSAGQDDDGGYRQRSTGIVIRDGGGKGKGKERAMEFTPKEEIFGVGELDEEDRTPAYEGEGVGGRH